MRVRRFALIALILLTFLCACAPKQVQPEATVSPTAQSAAFEPVERTRFVAAGDDWGYPSPFAFYQRGPGYIRMSYLFDTLVWKDEKGTIPWLAESWELAEDGKTWTFSLRQDVAWHDGQPLTADDVAFSYAYMAAAFDRGMVKWGWPLDKVAFAQASDDGRSVRIGIVEPTAGLLTDLFGSLPIIPRHVWESVEDPLKKLDEQAVMGSGPFVLHEYSKEEGRYVYHANPDYFLGAPNVDELVFVRVQDPSLALMSEEIDESSFSGKAIAAVDAFRKDDRFEILEGPNYWTLKLYFNPGRSPLDQRKVRRAIAYAVDRPEIVAKAQLGGAVVASTGLLSPGTFWHNPNLPTYDRDLTKSTSMLSEADALPMALELVTTATYQREAELIAVQLAEVGIEVTVKIGDRATVDALLNDGDFCLLITGHGGMANPDLDTPSPVWHNEAYQAVYQQSLLAVTDDTKRQSLVWQMQEIIAEELPVLALWHPLMWDVYRPGVVKPFYTMEGVDGGIPLPANKLMFLR